MRKEWMTQEEHKEAGITGYNLI